MNMTPMIQNRQTRTQSLMEVIRTQISSRALTPGDRLPSIRAFAKNMNVSPSTVVEAYARLEAEGLISAKKGAGFFVTGGHLPPMALTEMGEQRERDADPFWVARQSLDAPSNTLMPGCGWLPPSWMPHEALRKAMRALARGNDALLVEYGNTRGSLDLRRLLLARFIEEGLSLTANRIMLTGSGTQAIDLICRLLLRPGDRVLVDDPCYFNFQALLRAHQVKIVGVPFTPMGPDITAFERILEQETPRLYITNSALHNPTGATLSAPTLHQLLSLANTHGLTIVEDDIFADFEPAPSPRFAVSDGLNRVIRVGSFSKTLSASLRCGYIAASEDWIESLTDLQIATSFAGPSPIAAEVITHVLTGGSYRKHMETVRKKLVHAREALRERLQPLGIEPWIEPRGGFYLWCQLPDGLDASKIARRCSQENIILAPGNVFSVSQSASNFLRFNVAQTTDKKIFSVLQKAMLA